MSKTNKFILKYGHWTFLVSALVEASMSHWFLAASMAFLFINYQFLDKNE